MCDTSLDMVSGKMKEIICYKRRHWDNRGSFYMGCIVSGGIVPMLNFLNMITILYL